MFIGVGTWLSPHILIFLPLPLQHSHYWFIGVPRRWDLIRSTSMDASTIIFSGRRIIWDRLSLHHMEAELRVIFDGILLPRWLGLFDIWVEADLWLFTATMDYHGWFNSFLDRLNTCSHFIVIGFSTFIVRIRFLIHLHQGLGPTSYGLLDLPRWLHALILLYGVINMGFLVLDGINLFLICLV